MNLHERGLEGMWRLPNGQWAICCVVLGGFWLKGLQVELAGDCRVVSGILA